MSAALRHFKSSSASLSANVQANRELPIKIAVKFAANRPFANPDLAARKLVEIANDVEAVHDGRIYIERVNVPFLVAGGIGDDFRAGIERAIALGWLWRHESGTG